MSEEIEQTAPKSPEDQILEYTQSKRRSLIESLTKNNSQPDDRGDKMVLLSALDGMDRATLTKMRIKTDDKQANATSQAATAIAQLLNTVVPKQLERFDESRTAPMLDNDFPLPTFIEGETITGTQGGDYAEFMKKFPDEIQGENTNVQ